MDGVWWARRKQRRSKTGVLPVEREPTAHEAPARRVGRAVRFRIDEPELRERIRVFRALATAAARYAPPRTLRTPVYVMSAHPERPIGTWKGILDSARSIVVPGDHYSMLRSPNVASVAETIERLSTNDHRSEPKTSP